MFASVVWQVALSQLALTFAQAQWSKCEAIAEANLSSDLPSDLRLVMVFAMVLRLFDVVEVEG